MDGMKIWSLKDAYKSHELIDALIKLALLILEFWYFSFIKLEKLKLMLLELFSFSFVD